MAESTSGIAGSAAYSDESATTGVGGGKYPPPAMQFMFSRNADAEMIQTEVDRLMAFHPWDDAQRAAGAPVRAAANALIIAIVTHVRPSPDRSDAIRSVRNALYAANGAITHAGRY